jgi:hypothetical protein
MRDFDKLVWGVVALIFLPVLITPAGWAFAAIIATGWVVVTYGGRYLLDLEKQRRQGERGLAHDVRRRGRGGNE